MGGLTQDMTQALPHDVHGLEAYPVSYWLLILTIQGLVLLACLSWYFWRRRAKGQPALIREPEHPPADPYELALGRIEAMEVKDPFDKAAQKEFSFQLSLGLREIFELATKLNVTDKTYGELEQPVRLKSPLSREETDAMLAFLKDADLVKYADAELTAEQARSYWGQVVGWAKRLKPIPFTAFPMPSDHALSKTESGGRLVHF